MIDHSALIWMKVINRLLIHPPQFVEQRVRASCFAAFQAGWSLAGGSEQWSRYFSVAAFRSRFALKSQASHKANKANASSLTPKALCGFCTNTHRSTVCTSSWNPNAPKSLLLVCQTVFLVRHLLNVAQLLVEIPVQIIVLHEYSLFYGGSNAVETKTPVDIFKRKTKARLLERSGEDERDQGPSVTVNRAGVLIWATAHEIDARRKASWDFEPGSKCNSPSCICSGYYSVPIIFLLMYFLLRFKPVTKWDSLEYVWWICTESCI